MSPKKTIFFGIIILQILVISLLGYFIIRKRNNVVLGDQVAVNPIKKEDIQYTSKKLQYFYEPVANTVTEVTDWNPNDIPYKINSDTLRERKEYAVEKPPGTYRIVTLGDSFTYGLFVEINKIWPELLEDLLNSSKICSDINSFEVINLGVEGYDIQYAMERFQIRGKKYDPDMVIWFVKEDDVVQSNELMLGLERQYAEEMIENGEREKNIEDGDYYASWRKAYIEVYRNYGREKLMKRQEVFLEQFAQEFKGQIIFISYDEHEKEVGALLNPLINKYHHVRHFSNLTGFLKAPDHFIVNDGHPNKYGHTSIAHTVFNNLVNNNLITCN